MPRFIFNIEGIDEPTRSVRLTASSGNPVRSFIWNDDYTDIIEVEEIIESWNLDRYRDNPIFLWQHNREDPIGWGRDLVANGGKLSMRLEFAPKNVSGLADEKWEWYRTGLVKAFSIGFLRNPDDEVIDYSGDTPRILMRNIELFEVSAVTVPKDADALVSTSKRTVYSGEDSLRYITPEERSIITKLTPGGIIDKSYEDKKKRASEAGRLLSSMRKPKEERTDMTDVVNRYDFFGRLGKCERLDSGAVRVPATLSRVGVFTYRQADGPPRRELRPPDEVFREDSLASLRSAPVTDRHMGGMIDPDSWKTHSIGHTESAEQDGLAVAGNLVISDRTAIERIDAGERKDLSPGYRCRLDFTPGEYEGQPYDAIQRDIFYNHVTLCPPGGGRQGPEVALRLDARDAIMDCDASSVQKPNEDEMTEKTTVLVKLDGIEYEQGSPKHIAALEDINTKTVKAHATKLDEVKADHQKQLDQVTAERDGLQAKLDSAEKEKKEFQEKLDAAKSEEAIEKAVAERMGFQNKVAAVYGEKFDAKEHFNGKAKRDVMVEAIKFDDKDWSDKDRSEEYVRVRFDMVVEGAEKRAADHKERGVGAFAKAAHEGSRRLDGDSDEGDLEPTHRLDYAPSNKKQPYESTLARFRPEGA